MTFDCHKLEKKDYTFFDTKFLETLTRKGIFAIIPKEAVTKTFFKNKTKKGDAVCISKNTRLNDKHIIHG